MFENWQCVAPSKVCGGSCAARIKPRTAGGVNRDFRTESRPSLSLSISEWLWCCRLHVQLLNQRRGEAREEAEAAKAAAVEAREEELFYAHEVEDAAAFGEKMGGVTAQLLEDQQQEAPRVSQWETFMDDAQESAAALAQEEEEDDPRFVTVAPAGAAKGKGKGKRRAPNQNDNEEEEPPRRKKERSQGGKDVWSRDAPNKSGSDNTWHHQAPSTSHKHETRKGSVQHSAFGTVTMAPRAQQPRDTANNGALQQHSSNNTWHQQASSTSQKKHEMRKASAFGTVTMAPPRPQQPTATRHKQAPAASSAPAEKSKQHVGLFSR